MNWVGFSNFNLEEFKHEALKSKILFLLTFAGILSVPCFSEKLQFLVKDSEIYEQDTILWSPEELVQKQLEAYNNKDLETFLSFYSDNIRAFNFPDKEIFTGKNAMRAGYEALFNDNPNLYCEVSNRIVMNNIVVDHERISGLSNGNLIETIAIFKIENGKISRIYFLKE